MAKAGHPLDAELSDLPAELRWREWMGRVEAAIFASPTPVPRETLARLVGRTCVLDDLIADIRDELKPRPYDLVFVAGGFQHRSRPRFAEAIRAIPGGEDAGPCHLSKTESLAVSAIAYWQPVTRAAMSRLLGKEISRDIIARLKRLDLIGAGPSPARRSPMSPPPHSSRCSGSPACATCPKSTRCRRPGCSISRKTVRWPIRSTIFWPRATNRATTRRRTATRVVRLSGTEKCHKELLASRER
jgi:segregation and condensation protein B